MIMTLNERPLPLYHLSTCQYWQFKDECHSLLHKRNLSLTTIYIYEMIRNSRKKENEIENVNEQPYLY